MFLSGLKVWMALMRPIVPIEIRSSMWMPVFSNRRAMYTTSRRLCSMSREAASSLPAAVVERAAVLPLFPAVRALPDDAVQTLEALSALPECTGRVVLLPYRAVGVTGALLPAFRPDSVKIDGAAEPMLLALSAQALTSDGAFAMVLPPKS